MVARSVLVVLPCVAMELCSTAHAGDVLTFRNDTRRPMELWIWPYDSKQWKQPPLYLRPGESRPVEFATNGNYYLTFRDDLRRETPIGSVNVTRVCRENPDLHEVKISTITKTSSALCTVLSREQRRFIRGRVRAPDEEVDIVTWVRMR
jgi:hypothetical protein